ncbi:PD-(D/E)XK motif protein [Helicobacter ailurogastricus]|uniref:PD-(D/E)XK motif protein n=1 Tax=Helicobacter ailurogastricus TaxID=1578720 RepID=UPI0022BF2BED|nr:PD-(D/E)XK motif protein [Helicobacter ailurogastricus]GLH58238.1 hypothetical protein NHP214376_10280 [Helicobacter ailurogastricus]GLH59110.1 hypothetical protein NHP214377_03740 [Helicobacter ailurogastricus]
MNNPWQNMAKNTKRRVESDCAHDLFWMVDLEGRYILNIGVAVKTKPSKSVSFEGLGFWADHQEHATQFYLALSNHTNWQLFKLVCEDLIDLLDKSVDATNIAEEITKRLLKWKKLFASRGDFGLEAQMGLFGELHFLKEAMACLGVKDALDAWVFDTQDFLFNHFAVEIKTHPSSKPPKVTISSAEQLESNKEKLYLAAYALTQSTYGDSVEDLAKDIEGCIDDKTDVELFYTKLFEWGYKPSPDQMHRFKVEQKSIYEVVETFPKITRASIDPRIISVKYIIDLLQCTEFLVADLPFAGKSCLV